MDEINQLKALIAAMERRISALESAGPAPITCEIRHIVECVANAFGIDPTSIYPHGKRQPQVLARQFAMKMALNLHVGVAKTGRAFRRDHTTVLHAEKVVSRLIATSPAWAEKYASILERIKNERA